MEDTLSNKQVEKELAAVLESSAFSRPHHLRRLLKYLVEQTLRGEQDSLKETVLGMEVFDRGPNFDPRADPIVRIDARRLRARLEQYYSHEGAGDPMVIVLEPGSYVPQFQRRDRPRGSGHEALAMRRSVAVLPFVSLTGKPEQEFFGEGVGEEIINRLVKQQSLRVVARNLSFQFRDPQQDLRKIARRLQVDFLVTGTVRGEQEKLRITAQITQASDASILWSEQYDSPANEMLATQEVISLQVAGWLQGFTADKETRTTEIPLVCGKDSSAYHLFLGGKHFLHQGNPEAYFRSIQCLERAVAKDPGFAPAWAELSAAYAFVLLFRLRDSPEVVQRSRFAAEKALQLDEQLADAHSSLGLIAALGDYQLVRAAQHFNAALRVNPRHEHARAGRAMFCFAPAGYLDHAEDELELILSDHPPLALLNLGMILYFGRRFEQAAETLEAGLAMNPLMGGGWVVLGLVRERLGMIQKAREAYRQWERLFPFPFAQAWRRAAEHCLTGNLAAARRATGDFMEAHFKGDFSAPDLAVDLLIRLKDEDRALDWLERSYNDRVFRLIHAAVDPVFDPIRNTRRFAALLSRIIRDPQALQQIAEADQADGITPTAAIPGLEKRGEGARFV